MACGGCLRPCGSCGATTLRVRAIDGSGELRLDIPANMQGDGYRLVGRMAIPLSQVVPSYRGPRYRAHVCATTKNGAGR